MNRDKVREIIAVVADIAANGEDFFYVGGPMTDKPYFNFPRFEHVGARLRAAGWPIVLPTELDDDEVKAAAMRSPDGVNADVREEYADMLARDIIVCSLPNCVGGIFIEGWHESRGAREESRVLAFYGKHLMEYEEDGDDMTLRVVEDRAKRLEQLGAPDDGRTPVKGSAFGDAITDYERMRDA